MDTHPYHHYFVFELSTSFFNLDSKSQANMTEQLVEKATSTKNLIITFYATDGFLAGTNFMLWVRAADPSAAQLWLAELRRETIGQHLVLRYTYFGLVRNSAYSNRTGKPEQVMQNFSDRLPYFILYPFTKTHEWHQLGFEERKKIMGEHVKVGLSHEKIRQCLLYSYGLSDCEFVVSYETTSLEDFQDLVIQMRATKGRPYTLLDTPIHVGIYKTWPEVASCL